MSEHSQSQTLARENFDDENDPLAELARIVAGEPEPEPEPVSNPDPVTQHSELGMADGSDTSLSGVDQAIDDAANELQAMLSGKAVEQALSPVAPSESDAEAAFQDELISALEDEINGPAQAPELPQPSLLPAEESAAPAGQDASGFEEVESIEDQLASVLGLDVDNPVQSEPSPASLVGEEPPIEQALVEPHEPEIVAPEPETGNFDEDLGAAFANQFEQMLEQSQPPVHAEIAAPELTEAPVEQAIHEQAPDQAFQTVQEDPPAQDLDFGSMFAEELGVNDVQDIEGWQEQDNYDAQQDFARAVAAENDPHARYAGGEYVEEADPGHTATLAVAEELHHDDAPHAAPVDSRKYAVAALVIALFAGTIAAGYGFLGGGDAGVGSGPQIVKADASPFKVKPEDPGGRIPANQDKASYERVAGEAETGASQENLVSNTEEPANLTGSSEITVQEAIAKSDDRLSPGQNSEPARNTTPGDLAPRVVKTVTVRPDGTLVADPVQLQQSAELATQAVEDVVADTGQAAAAIVGAEARQVETSVIKAPEPIDGLNSTGVLPVPETSPVAKPAPAPVVAETVTPQPQQPEEVETAELVAPQPAVTAPSLPAAKSEWVVQISSQRSAEAAQASYENLRGRFSAVQGRPMSIQQADVNGSTFYRVRLQTESKDDAARLCSQLKAQGGSCFVSR